VSGLDGKRVKPVGAAGLECTVARFLLDGSKGLFEIVLLILLTNLVELAVSRVFFRYSLNFIFFIF